jgi:hypothetical protein
MRTILLHYFCSPPYIQNDDLTTRFEYIKLGFKHGFPSGVVGARENRDYLSGALVGSFFGAQEEDLVRAVFVTETERLVNAARFLHCATDLLVHYEFYHLFGSCKVEALPVYSLDVFKTVAADHGLSVEVSSVLDLYKPVEAELEKKAKKEWLDKENIAPHI